MLFTSYEFIGFIAILLIAYYLVPRRVQAPLLLVASWVFYAFSGWENLLFIAFTVLTVWAGGLLLEKNFARQDARLAEGTFSPEEKKAFKDGQKKRRRGILTAVLLLNLGVLAVVKYVGFAFGIVNGVAGTSLTLPSDWLMPMGISFYTFQSIGYLIDVFRRTTPAEKNLWKYALFVSFFPQLVQGPISRWGELSQTLLAPHPFRSEAVRRGLQRVLWGYFKKMVIADRLTSFVITVGGGDYRGGYALALIFVYTIQLYADFTGGLDITIGLAEAMGITLTENFHRPFCADSLKDYWRRWHISMGTWFKDYLFYPVSTSRFMRAVTRKTKEKLGVKAGRKIPLYLSSFIVWGATGLWHGANWNFVVWGLLNWLILMISQECEGLYAAFHKRFPKARGTPWRIFAAARTFLLVSVLKMFDCFPTIADTTRAFFSIFVPSSWAGFTPSDLLSVGVSGKDFIVAALASVLMFGVSLSGAWGDVRERFARKPFALRLVLILLLVFVILVFGAYGRGYDAGQFIYNRF